VCKHIAGDHECLPVALSRLHAVEPMPIPLECEGHLRLVAPERAAPLWKSQVGKIFATHHCMSCRKCVMSFLRIRTRTHRQLISFLLSRVCCTALPSFGSDIENVGISAQASAVLHASSAVCAFECPVAHWSNSKCPCSALVSGFFIKLCEGFFQADSGGNADPV
jgi:hypothetical protein